MQEISWCTLSGAHEDSLRAAAADGQGSFSDRQLLECREMSSSQGMLDQLE